MATQDTKTQGRQGRRHVTPRRNPPIGGTTGSGASHLSPLGMLFRREAERAARRWPQRDARDLDEHVTIMVAHAFLDADRDELVRAVMEGSIVAHGLDRADYARAIVRRALAQVHHD